MEGRGIFFCRGRDQADTGWSSCSLVREQLTTCYFIMKGWLNIIFWCERFIITLKKIFFVWILWSLLHCFAIDGQRKRKLWIRSDLERDTERLVCLMLFFLCLCNNWRHWCEVGENLLFQIAEVNCVHSVDYQISLEYLVLKMFELTSNIHVTCMILTFSLQLIIQILSINQIMSLISILVWVIGEKL